MTINLDIPKIIIKRWVQNMIRFDPDRDTNSKSIFVFNQQTIMNWRELPAQGRSCRGSRSPPGP